MSESSVKKIKQDIEAQEKERAARLKKVAEEKAKLTPAELWALDQAPSVIN